MKKSILLLLLLSSIIVKGQTTYQLNYDSIRVGKTAGTGGTSLYGKVHLKNVSGGLGTDSILTVRNGRVFKVLPTITVDSTIYRTVANSRTLAQTQTALDLKATDASVVHKTGNETIADTKTFTGVTGFKNATYPGIRGLDIFHYGQIPSLPTAGIDIPNEIYRWGYETVISTNEKRYLPLNMNSTAFDPTFPVNILEFGYEGISTHNLHGLDTIKDGGKDFMIWNNRWKDVRTLASQDNIAGPWFQLHTGIYSEMQDGGNSTTWHSNAPATTPFQYYRKQSSTFTDPAFIYQSSGDTPYTMKMVYRRNRNLLSNPVPINDGDEILNLTAQSATGNSNWGNAGFIKFKSGGASSLTASGGTFHLATSLENTVTPIERFSIDKLGRGKYNGAFSVGGGDPFSAYGLMAYSPTAGNFAASFRERAGIGFHSLNVTVNNANGKNLISSNVFVGGAAGFIPLSLSARDFDADFTLLTNGNVQIGNLSTAGIVTNTAGGVLGTITTIPNSYIATATSLNNASSVVLRDASGNFAAGTITAALNGNALTATNWGGLPANFSAFGTTPGYLLGAEGGVAKPYSASQIQSFLGLGSNAYNSTAYLPLTGGTLSGALTGTSFIKSYSTFGTPPTPAYEPILTYGTGGVSQAIISGGNTGTGDFGTDFLFQVNSTLAGSSLVPALSIIAGSGTATVNALVPFTGTTATFSSLSGSGDVLTSANNSGVLSKVAIGSGLSLSAGVLTATGGSAGTITGSGTAGRIAKWTSASNVGDASSLTISGNDLQVAGIVQGTSLTSTVLTGTAPLTVASTTPVSNLSIGGNASTATLASNSTLWGGTSYAGPYAALSGANFTGLVTSNNAFSASRARSNLVAAGPYYEMLDPVGSRGYLMQLNANSGIDFWQYNGATWAVKQTFNSDGGAAFTGTITAPNFSGSLTGNAATATNWGGRSASLVGTLTSSLQYPAGLDLDGTVKLVPQDQFRTFLGLGSNAYTSTAFAPLTSPALTGSPTAPTAAPGTNTTQIATTAYVAAATGTGGKQLEEWYADAQNTGASATDLYSFSVPGNTLVNNGDKLAFSISGLYGSNSNSKTLTINFVGGFSPNSSTGFGDNWNVSGYLIKTGATTYRIAVNKSDGPTSGVIVGTGSSMDFTVSNTFKIVGTGTASGDITAYNGYLEFKPAGL